MITEDANVPLESITVLVQRVFTTVLEFPFRLSCLEMMVELFEMIRQKDPLIPFRYNTFRPISSEVAFLNPNIS